MEYHATLNKNEVFYIQVWDDLQDLFSFLKK